MAHRYMLPIRVDLGPHGTPTAFTWRGERYAVRVNSKWKLATGWWDPSARAERTYYRCQAADHQVFEVFQDTLGGGWVLDCVLD